jgi:uncharacterized protein YjeT (DUF2065 family)
MADLWAALSLVLVLEGLLLFAAPAAWKKVVTQIATQPDRKLSAVGGFMVIAGILALYYLRGG